MCGLLATVEMFSKRYVMNYFQLLHIFQIASVNALCKMRAALTHPASKLSKISLRLDDFACYVLVVKMMKFKMNLVF